MKTVTLHLPEKLVQTLDERKKHLSRTAYVIHLLNTALEIKTPLPKGPGRPNSRAQKEEDRKKLEEINRWRVAAGREPFTELPCEK